MIQPVSTETAFQALFTLLAATQLNGAPAFITTSRRLPPPANVSTAQQPALYMLESDEVVTENGIGLPVEELKCVAIVLFRVTPDPNTVYSTQLNNLRDAVINQLRQMRLAPGGVLPASPQAAGELQTLGGLVYNCRVLGTILKNEGLQNQQGAIVFPISIRTGI